LFVVIFSRWLVPTRERAGGESFDTGVYLTEARINEDSRAVGKTLHELAEELEHADAQVIGLVRNDVRDAAPNPRRVLYAGDILVIEAEPESLAEALSKSGLALEEAVPAAKPDTDEEVAEETTDDPGTNGRTDGTPAVEKEPKHKSDTRKDD